MEVIMKTTDENGKGLTNKNNASLGKKEEDKKGLGRSSGDVSNKKEDIEGLGKEENLGGGASMSLDRKALENKKREGGEVGKETGGITGESKSIHVEDWENDPFTAKGQEDDVRAEFALRKNKNVGNGKGVENTGTGGEGRSMGSGPDSKKYNTEDESGESGV
jgi:hypothetical protein